ncbi:MULTISPECIES: chemotaxis protein CheW [unclassified Shewanella]|uniref:chemotaxis protein CheW n=1 Tax=unclassified Shewanella TaxID=196818 RepID=UPI001BB9F92F|nr:MULTISPECIES: chemotaxis protein CheW [unclassified Shewanella]GIU09983.1 chemotaxis protein CheW [Shewanella sp. MBTL60-112-B1]GIU37293.1 chemotaxis protein CheW [Shewanella sp. MBTL60-112-B2]
MSKSVDDAVCDYFSLLLNEPAANKAENDSRQEPQLAETLDVDSDFSRQALELLFTRANQAESQQATQTLTDAVSVCAQPVIAEVSNPVAAEVAAQVELVKNQDEAQLKALEEIKTQALQDKGTQLKTSTLAASDVAPAFQASAEVISVASEQEMLVSTETLLEQLDDEFQVLFFNVAGLTLAVPLVSLGGIVSLDKVTRLMGRPDWYMGVQQYRETQLNVVDTCAWVMPEKYDEQLAQSVSYQYVVVLKDSAWGLGCESLVDTITIKKSEINWRSQAGKRPWLAGVVKEQMCGILNVDALVQMLGSGLGCQDALL